MPLQADVVAWARQEAEHRLSRLGQRWAHVQGVARCASFIARLLPAEEGSLLVAAAWVHDIGYAPEIVETGFHPLDGAIFLRRKGHERLACLVAHHTGALFEARLRGLAKRLASFPRESSAVADALTYCDLIIGPSGESMDPVARRADIVSRYGEGHLVSQALALAWPDLEGQIERTRQLLARNMGDEIDFQSLSGLLQASDGADQFFGKTGISSNPSAS